MDNNEKKELNNKPEENATANKDQANGNGNNLRRKDLHGKRKVGLNKGRREEKEKLGERIVEINRISKTVQGGRHMRFSALAVVGDFHGRYGFAMEKSGEVPDAIKKATEAARHNMYTLKALKGGTITHEVTGKFGATKVYLKPAPNGTGIIAGGAVRAILELVGLKNVVSKVYGARASINVVRATHNAILQLKSYKEVQVLRGLVKEEAKEAK